jgi:hypothetical protein
LSTPIASTPHAVNSAARVRRRSIRGAW